jgi:hypothetical protein
MMRAWVGLETLCLAVVLAVAGCDGYKRASESALPPAELMAESVAARNATRLHGLVDELPQTVGPGEPADKPAPNTPAGLSRKIIYTANVDLVVEDFSPMPERVGALVKKYDAYVAGSSLTGKAGDSRRATWKIRVPVARFDEFVAAAKELGELVTASTTSQDVSEEYYDVDARIRNKTKEEERLLKLLEERPGKLEDVIAIERELSRVREELERMQGRLRVLADMTSMTTVQLSVSEIRGYEPPQAATFVTRTARALDGSLTALLAAGEAIVIAVVIAAPWLPAFILALALAYYCARKCRRLLSAKRPTENVP